jgi:trans-2,3-dihydro-3-hydroxyanthranilate isomerase
MRQLGQRRQAGAESERQDGRPAKVVFGFVDWHGYAGWPCREGILFAREQTQSETAFVLDPREADFRARYFTPAEEIPLAGHPTLAVTRALLDCGRLSWAGEDLEFGLELPAATVRVRVKAPDQKICMRQPAPKFLRSYDRAEVAFAFGLDADELLGNPQTVSTGTPQLMVLVRDLAVLARATVNLEAFGRLRACGDFFSPHLFCQSGFTAHGQTAARHFGLPPDTLEDPFTGSATGAMAAYLWKHGLISEKRFVAEQGHGLGRPGQAEVRIVGDDPIEAVMVMGHAVVVARGEFLC